eukprot:28412-Hanusia_phi.AAC.14
MIIRSSTQRRGSAPGCRARAGPAATGPDSPRPGISTQSDGHRLAVPATGPGPAIDDKGLRAENVTASEVQRVLGGEGSIWSEEKQPGRSKPNPKRRAERGGRTGQEGAGEEHCLKSARELSSVHPETKMRIKTCLSDRTNSSSVGEETMKRGSTGEMKDDAQSKCNISPNTQELLRMQSFQNEDDGINLPSPRRLQMDKMSPSKDQTLSECPAGGSQNLSPNTAELHGLQDMIDFDNEEFSPTTLNFDSACPRLNQIEPVSLVDQRTSQRKSLPASKPSTHSKDVGKSKIPKLFPKEPQVNGSTPDAREGGEKSLAKMKASASLNRKRNDSASKRLQGKISPKNLPSPKSLSPTESAKSESPALRKEIEPLPLLSAQAVGSAVRSMLSSTSAVENESEAVEACSRQLGVEEDAASAGEEKTCRSPASVKLEVRSSHTSNTHVAEVFLQPEDLDESQEVCQAGSTTLQYVDHDCATQETAANVEGEQDGIVLTPSDGKCCGHDPAYGGNEALETTPTNLVEVPYEKGVLLESSRKTQEIKERFAKYKREQLEKSQSKLSAAKGEAQDKILQLLLPHI